MGVYLEGEARVLSVGEENSVPIRSRDVHWERYVSEEREMGAEMRRVATLDCTGKFPPFDVGRTVYEYPAGEVNHVEVGFFNCKLESGFTVLGPG